LRLAWLIISYQWSGLLELGGLAPIKTQALASLASASAAQISMIARKPVTNAFVIACLADAL